MTPDESPAIVLRASSLAEADVLVVLLTPQHGKIRAAARSARRSQRRFAGGLQAGACGEATLAHKAAAHRGSALWRLDGFRPQLQTGSLGRNLERFAYAAYLCELTDVAITEPLPDPELFGALWSALAQVLEGPSRPSVLRRYELAVLRAVGHAPALHACCVCGDPLALQDARVAYDATRGGALCPTHADAYTGAHVLRAVPAAAVTLAADLLAGEGEAAQRRLDEAPLEVRRAVRDIALAPLRAVLPRPLRSLAFLQQVGAAPGAQE